MKHSLRLRDREISSGSQGEALASVRRTSRVSGGESFRFGAVCPQLLEVSLLELEAPIPVGEKLELLKGDKLLGTFYCQNTEASGAVTNLTAYDSLYLLEADVTDWLSSLNQWPYTLEDFAHLVCQACGVTLADDPIPGGNYAIPRFTGSTTGRALLGFAAEVAGCYVQADEAGVAHFRWYERKEVPEPVCLSRKMQALTTKPAHKVQLQGTSQDVGVIYPDTAGDNTYQVTGNPLLSGDVLPIAQNLFEKLQGVSYTPGVIRVQGDCPLQAGDIFKLDGQDFYVMQAVESAAGLELSCFGQEKFGSVAVRNQEKFSSLSGKVLELTARVEGLLAENRDMAGNLSRLSLDVAGISGQVAAQSGENARLSQSISQIDQKAEGISVAVRQIRQEGAQRVETAFGVTLDGSCLTVARQGSEMENRLDETGMYVRRGNDVMLQANANGVLATDVTVRNYLRLGDHARFEDYGTDRTACYYC